MAKTKALISYCIADLRLCFRICNFFFSCEGSCEGLSEPEFYGDLVYKFKKLIGRKDFSFQFRKNHYTLQAIT